MCILIFKVLIFESIIFSGIIFSGIIFSGKQVERFIFHYSSSPLLLVLSKLLVKYYENLKLFI